MYKLLLIRLNFIVLLMLVGKLSHAQDLTLKPAFDFPTKEIYDLHIDKHGFLWIASDIGISRYDGVNCVHFSSPQQISLGCTNLLEDNYGRIWFNNFNGQIFYVLNETMTLLESYHAKSESNFPKMALFHNKLLATSDSGLFVLDTKNLTGAYISRPTFTSSLAVLKNQVMVRGSNAWYSYQEGEKLRKIVSVEDNQAFHTSYVAAFNTYHDTVYTMSNPSGIVRKLVLKNDTLRQCQQIKFDKFINTLTITADNQWVNTNGGSYSLKNGQQIKGYNLSDIITDPEGNKWYSSLFFGLLMQPPKDIAEKISVPGLDKDDLVLSIRRHQNKLLLGTQKGYLMLYDPVLKSTSIKIKISPTAGSVYNITAINDNEYMVALSLSTFKVNIATKKVTDLVAINAIKQLCYDSNAVYIASSSGLFVIPRGKSTELNRKIMAQFGNVFTYIPAYNYFYLKVRSRAVTYFPEQGALFASLKNQLFRIDRNGMRPFLYHDNQVFAASLAYSDHKIYVGTITNGMLIVDKNQVQHISVQNGLFSKSIFKIKPVDKNLWILGTGPLQIFNTEKKVLVDDYQFPDRRASEVLDIAGIGKNIYLATSSGLDNFPLVKSSAGNKLKNYLLYVKINNQIRAPNSRTELPYAENNVLFNIGIPAYSKARDIYIKYCLATKSDNTWLTTEPGERTIRFSSLMPGSYRFKAYAIDPRLGVADTVIKYSFSIAQPWWGSTAFKMLLIVLFILIILYLYVAMLLKRLSLKKAFDMQQALVLAERQRISAEIHDDIGSGIFAIHTFANAVNTKETASPEIEQIKNMITDLSGKIREVIWSTNVGNDNVENLFYYTYFQINKLFEHSEIKLISQLPDDIIDLEITGQSRRNIYLLIKEVVHNAIKHSKASQIELKMFTDEQMLNLMIKDNGVGININHTKLGGMGLGNITSRVEKLNGKISIVNNNGASVYIKIPLQELRPIEFDKKLNDWQLFITDFFKNLSARFKS